MLVSHRQNCRLGIRLQVFEEKWLDEEVLAGCHVEYFFDSDDEDFLLGMTICKVVALLLGSLITERRNRCDWERMYDLVYFVLICQMSCL